MLSSSQNQEEDESRSTPSTPSTPTMNTPSKKKTRLTYSLDSVNRVIEENEEVESLNTTALSPNAAENKESPKQVKSCHQSNASSLNADILDIDNAPKLIAEAREQPPKLIIKPKFLELAEIVTASESMSQHRALVGEEPSISSSTGSNNQSLDTESSAEEGVTVRYDYIFKTPLNNVDANGTSLQVPKAEAEEHFPPLQANGRSVNLQLHDFDRKQILEWGFIRHNELYCICRKWREYVVDNQLHKGDYVVFYQTDENQGTNNELAPRYAIQFEKKA